MTVSYYIVLGNLARNMYHVGKRALYLWLVALPTILAIVALSIAGVALYDHLARTAIGPTSIQEAVTFTIMLAVLSSPVVGGGIAAYLTLTEVSTHA